MWHAVQDRAAAYDAIHLKVVGVVRVEFFQFAFVGFAAQFGTVGYIKVLGEREAERQAAVINQRQRDAAPIGFLVERMPAAVAAAQEAETVELAIDIPSSASGPVDAYGFGIQLGGKFHRPAFVTELAVEPALFVADGKAGRMQIERHETFPRENVLSRRYVVFVNHDLGFESGDKREPGVET